MNALYTDLHRVTIGEAGQMMMHKAIESRTRFKDGKLVEREWSIGPVLIWGLVAIVLGLAGHAVIPPSVWTRLIGG